MKIQNFINGDFAEPISSNYFDNITPVTGEVYSQIPDSDSSDIDREVPIIITTHETTFKLINSLIALQEKSLNIYSSYNCVGGFEYAKDKIVGCHKHSSPLSFKKAIAISCNSYFCNVFQGFFDKFQFLKRRTCKKVIRTCFSHLLF